MAWPKKSVFGGGSGSNGTGVGAVIPQGGIPTAIPNPIPQIARGATPALEIGGGPTGGAKLYERGGIPSVRAMPLKQREAVMGKLRGPVKPQI